jgi:hypothetical protein
VQATWLGLPQHHRRPHRRLAAGRRRRRSARPQKPTAANASCVMSRASCASPPTARPPSPR